MEPQFSLNSCYEKGIGEVMFSSLAYYYKILKKKIILLRKKRTIPPVAIRI